MKHQMEIEPEDHDLCKKSFVLAIRDALNVVSGKWKLAIVCTLLSGPKGFADIERLLATISPRMLSRELRELELNGAITRCSPDTDARDRRYKLTPSSCWRAGGRSIGWVRGRAFPRDRLAKR
jgi:DNA-binding HxlR family transcriptional regulator